MGNNSILCIETATEVCSVAIYRSDYPVLEKSEITPNAHSTKLTILIEELLKEAGMSHTDLSVVAYSSGPGSYTGLRIGLSVAKGICYGADLPLIEVPTLQHMSLGAAERMEEKMCDFYFPMIDARRMEVYAAMLDHSGNFKIPPFPCLVEEYDWKELLESGKICFFGNGLSKSIPILSQYSNAYLLENYTISAATMGPIASKKWEDQKLADLALSTPFYLKDANVTKSKKNPL